MVNIDKITRFFSVRDRILYKLYDYVNINFFKIVDNFEFLLDVNIVKTIGNRIYVEYYDYADNIYSTSILIDDLFKFKSDENGEFIKEDFWLFMDINNILNKTIYDLTKSDKILNIELMLDKISVDFLDSEGEEKNILFNINLL